MRCSDSSPRSAPALNDSKLTRFPQFLTESKPEMSVLCLLSQGVNVMMRVIAVKAASKPLVEITQDGETLSIKTSTSVRTTHITFTVGQEFNEATVDGRPCTVRTHTEACVLYPCTHADYINLFNLAFHPIWPDCISLPLPWSLKAYHATIRSFTLLTPSLDFPSSLRSHLLPFPALCPSLILPHTFPFFPKLPLLGRLQGKHKQPNTVPIHQIIPSFGLSRLHLSCLWHPPDKKPSSEGDVL